ncbi:N-acetylgalactosamine kinase [Neocloeon triangulifer]|uniref:N-acetylgalactosamine kinase n=1 Tax=Neocloeon triangulifer TaxID=2078957 RepID=UPI00286F45C4|nr:N-acetylgalactosamine kinase [Neocloeon triangulifer]
MQNNGQKGDCQDAPIILSAAEVDDRQLRDGVTQVKSVFQQKFNALPEFYVRVPGRVNLIGEHIDYCGYAVCPMALRQHILLAVGTTEEPILSLTNADEKYKDFHTEIETLKIEVLGAPQWHQYFMCGVKGVLENVLPQKLKGLRVVVFGNIPPSSGLSSSSALVCSAALCTSHAYNVNISKRELATLSAKCERYIGTEGGGMDQAIAFLGEKGCAKLIEFNPLRDTSMKLPPNAVFVISHSLAEMNKAATADFNCRVIECRLACQIIAKLSGLNWEKLTKLADLQKELAAPLEEMVNKVQQLLHQEPYSKEEICQILETSEEALNKLTLSENTKNLQQFKLNQRALHVYQEALRVQEFFNCGQKGASLETLGALMNASHASLKDLYQCSHPDLDKLVTIGEKFRFGARLTGAGWGGCSVALTSPENASDFVVALKEEFYSGHPAAIGKNIDRLVFVTEPQEGAFLIVE